MHIDALDSYRPGDSPVHRLDGRVKLLLLLFLVLVVALIPDRAWVAFAGLQVLLWSVALLSRVGLGLVQRRAVVALPFALAALTVAFATPGRALLTLPLPGGAWVMTDAGLLRFVSILARSYLSVQAAVIVTATTPFPDLLWAARVLRIPRVLVAVGGFLYRYLFVLADEAQRLLRAREARSAVRPGRRSGGSLLWRARVTGAMAGSLFIRSYERSERIYVAMLARGYDGEVRTIAPPALRPADLAVGLSIALFLALVPLLVRLRIWLFGWGM